VWPALHILRVFFNFSDNADTVCFPISVFLSGFADKLLVNGIFSAFNTVIYICIHWIDAGDDPAAFVPFYNAFPICYIMVSLSVFPFDL
jgi:hypothetical protein